MVRGSLVTRLMRETKDIDIVVVADRRSLVTFDSGAVPEKERTAMAVSAVRPFKCRVWRPRGERGFLQINNAVDGSSGPAVAGRLVRMSTPFL